MIDPEQFRMYVVRPTQQYLDPEIPYSKAAENLLVGIAAQESNIYHLKQIGGGPALGPYQIEPYTHSSLWDDYLYRYPNIASKVRSLASQYWPQRGFHDELVTNLAYSTAMTRVNLWQQPQALPDENDIPGLARYWKRWHNTDKGDGRVEQFIKNYPNPDKGA